MKARPSNFGRFVIKWSTMALGASDTSGGSADKNSLWHNKVLEWKSDVEWGVGEGWGVVIWEVALCRCILKALSNAWPTLLGHASA